MDWTEQRCFLCTILLYNFGNSRKIFFMALEDNLGSQNYYIKWHVSAAYWLMMDA